MSIWLDARVRDVRRRLTSDDEGSLWLLLLDRRDGAVVVAAAFDQAMASIDDEMTRNLRHMIELFPAPAALLVVPRGDGLPLNADRDLWHQLRRARRSGTEVIDLLVVGRDSYWSAAGRRRRA